MKYVMPIISVCTMSMSDFSFSVTACSYTSPVLANATSAIFIYTRKRGKEHAVTLCNAINDSL